MSDHPATELHDYLDTAMAMGHDAGLTYLLKFYAGIVRSCELGRGLSPSQLALLGDYALSGMIGLDAQRPAARA